jgi:hypothetical protein
MACSKNKQKENSKSFENEYKRIIPKRKTDIKVRKSVMQEEG